MITGMYVRIERDGAWQNLEINELTDQELDAFAARQLPEYGWSWAKALARWIRDHVVDEEQEPSD